MSRAPAAALAAASIIAACESATSPLPRHDTISADAMLLGPAIWSVEFVATEGSRTGSRVTGMLTLLRTSAEDRSPATGERASDHDIAQVPSMARSRPT
ncbi:MAG: hypothetical protein JNK67_08025 [Alphaproteobacteria bacterium]|nr:hypothetical protein [Alphaproteobacteria bacterium]